MTKKLIKGYVFAFRESKSAGMWVLVLSFVAVLVSGAVPIVTSYILKNVVAILEIALKNKGYLSYSHLLLFISGYAAFTVFYGALRSVNMVANRILGMYLAQSIKEKIVKKIENVSHKIFYNPEFQNEYTSILTGSQSEPLRLMSSTFYLAINIIQIAGIFLVLFKHDYLPLVVLCVFLLLNMFIQFKVQSEYVNVWSLQSKSMRKLSYFFDKMTKNETLKEMQIFNLYGYFIKNMQDAFKENILVWKKFGRTEVAQNITGQLFACVGLVIAIFYLVISSVNKNCSLADCVFYINLMLNLQNICDGMVRELADGYRSILFIDRLLNFLNVDCAVKGGQLIPKDKTVHTLVFCNVSFKYPGNENYALRNINFEITSGEKACLVGCNGCGKTTVINLILRIYDPTEGTILLDGVDIKNYSVKEYRKIITPIFQDFQKYAIPIKNYIAFSNIENFDNYERMNNAVAITGASDFIDKATNRFDANLTKLFDWLGLELSLGEWQRLAISRVFFSDASLLIFDEPTSSLDVEVEAKIYNQIQKLGKDKIVIFVSHRLYAVEDSSKIIYLEKGNILGVGKHDELIHSCVGYRNLYEKQVINCTSV